MAAFYENITTPWSADKYAGLCSITTTSRVGGGQRRRLVYTSTSSQLYIHVVNVTGGRATDDHVLLRYDGRFRQISVAVSKVCRERNHLL